MTRLTLFSFFAFSSLATAQISGAAQTAHDAGNFDGVVVLSQNGKVVEAAGFGLADRGAKTPNRPDTLFRLASLTKQVTALLVMQEVTAGRFTLDQKAGTVLSSLPPAFSHVTVRQLLQHVSGLPNPSDGPDTVVPPFYIRTAADTPSLTKGSLSFCYGTAKRAAGGKFEYNNCDYIVLGALLEAATGKTYEQLVRERVIQPLDLKSWGLFPADPKRAPLTARAYKESGAEDDPQNPATYGAAGGLYGNALDLATWNDAVLTHKLLSAEVTDTMFRPDPKLYGEALGSWAYDLSFHQEAVHIVERQGDIGSTQLLTLLLPQKNGSVVIIANTDNADLFNTYSKKGLGYQILEAWFGKSVNLR